MSKLAGRIRTARSYLGMTQEQLSEMAGVHKNTLQRIEMGEVGSLQTLDPIIEVLEKLGQPIVWNENQRFAFARGYYDGRTVGTSLDIYDEADLLIAYGEGVAEGVTDRRLFISRLPTGTHNE